MQDDRGIGAGALSCAAHRELSAAQPTAMAAGEPAVSARVMPSADPSARPALLPDEPGRRHAELVGGSRHLLSAVAPNLAMASRDLADGPDRSGLLAHQLCSI